MTQVLLLASAMERIAESKKRSDRRDKAKAYNNAHDEQRKQRFFERSHGELGFV
jgi:hypothetical protein